MIRPAPFVFGTLSVKMCGRCHTANDPCMKCRITALFTPPSPTYHSLLSVRADAARQSETMSGNENQKSGEDNPQTGVVIKTRPKTKRPSMYKVLMLNDDYTPMEFVVHVLERFFGKNRDEAHRIMLHVHQRGVGVCGVYTYEVAETKVTQVMDLARQNQHPLQCTIEKE